MNVLGRALENHLICGVFEMARSMLGIVCMATARRFEDLEAWQLASELTDTVFRLTENGRAATGFEFCDQIRESAQNALLKSKLPFLKCRNDGRGKKRLRRKSG